MKQILKTLGLVSNNGIVSSKRMITLLAFLMMSIGFMANLFFDTTIDRFIFESMQWIVMFGLGATASERFSSYVASRHNKPKKEEEKTESKDEIDSI